jgi:hypothetical protein
MKVISQDIKIKQAAEQFAKKRIPRYAMSVEEKEYYRFAIEYFTAGAKATIK